MRLEYIMAVILTGADFSDKDKEFALSIQAHNAVERRK